MFFNFLIPIHFIATFIFFLVFILLMYLLMKHYFKKSSNLKKILLTILILFSIFYLTSFVLLGLTLTFNLFQLVFTPIIWIIIYFIQLFSSIINLGFPIYLIILGTFIYFKKPIFYKTHKNNLLTIGLILLILYFIYTSMVFVFLKDFLF